MNSKLIISLIALTIFASTAFCDTYSVVTIESTNIRSSHMRLHKSEVPHYRFAKAFAKVVHNTKGNVNLRTHTVEAADTEKMTLADGTELHKLMYMDEFDFFGLQVTLLTTYDEPDIVSAICAKDGRLTASWLLSLGQAYTFAHKILTENKYGPSGKRYGWLRMMATSLSVYLYNSTSASFRMSDSRRLKAVEVFLTDTSVNHEANGRTTSSCFATRLVELKTTSCMIFRDGEAMGKDAVKILVDILNNKSSQKHSDQRKENDGLRKGLDMLGVQTGW